MWGKNKKANNIICQSKTVIDIKCKYDVIVYLGDTNIQIGDL